MLITTEGIIIQLKCADISKLGRITSGVKLINLDEGVTVATISKVRRDDDVDASDESEENSGQDENQNSSDQAVNDEANANVDENTDANENQN